MKNDENEEIKEINESEIEYRDEFDTSDEEVININI